MNKFAKREVLRIIWKQPHVDSRLKIKADALVLKGHDRDRILEILRNDSLAFDEAYQQLCEMESPAIDSVLTA